MNRQLFNSSEKWAALYVRLSRDDENEGDSNSIAHQIEILTKYVKDHGITSYKVYKDDGYSGTSFKRPGFQEMLADIEAGLCTHRRTALLRFPPAASSCLSPLRRKRKRHLALWPGAFSCAWRVYPSGLSCCASGAGPFSASSGSIKSSMWHSRAWATL